MLNAVDHNEVSIVVMIDTAIDTVDIPTAINILQNDFGINDTPLNWNESSLTRRTVKVVIDNSFSDT